MKLWVGMEDVPSVAFLVPKKNPSNTQLVVFHISLSMGYVDNAPYFCMATETVADLANKAISQRDQAREHPLGIASEDRAVYDSGAPEARADASWEHLPAEQCSSTTANVSV